MGVAVPEPAAVPLGLGQQFVVVIHQAVQPLSHGRGQALPGRVELPAQGFAGLLTYRSYRLYIAGRDYRDYPLWFSSPVVSPIGKGWDFWQYSHSASLTGYSGPEACIDLNVFRGSMEEFRRFGCPD